MFGYALISNCSRMGEAPHLIAPSTHTYFSAFLIWVIDVVSIVLTNSYWSDTCARVIIIECLLVLTDDVLSLVVRAAFQKVVDNVLSPTTNYRGVIFPIVMLNDKQEQVLPRVRLAYYCCTLQKIPNTRPDRSWQRRRHPLRHAVVSQGSSTPKVVGLLMFHDQV